MDPDIGSFHITYLADHYYVGVLPDNMPETSGKGKADLGPYLYLSDALHQVFHRFFYCYDLLFRCVDSCQRGIKRSGLAAACRPCNKYHAVRLQYDILINIKERTVKAYFFKCDK